MIVVAALFGVVAGYLLATRLRGAPLGCYWCQIESAWVLVGAGGVAVAKVSPCVTGGYQDAFGWGHDSAESAIVATNRKLRRIGWV